MDKKSANIFHKPYIPKVLIAGSIIVIIFFIFLFKIERAGKTATTPRPNIVFILADDLDLKLGSVSPTYTPNLFNLIVNQGATFSNFVVNFSECCPSRSTILRGQYDQNTKIWGNSPPNGGFETFYAKGEESSTIATWLHNSGYKTVLFGKYLNGYPNTAPSNYIPPGWDEWYGTTTGAYFNYTMNENGVLKAYGSSDADYETDVISSKSADFVTRVAPTGQPFFMYIAPHAVHTPANPPTRYSTLYNKVSAPRTASFNEADVSDKPRWVQALPLLTATDEAAIDKLYKKRLRTLKALDDLVGNLVNTLQNTGQLNNTYVVFTSDNGFHMGQHRLNYGKITPFVEDNMLPLYIRGPAIPAGATITNLVSNADFAPTFAEIAGISPDTFVDGRSFAGLMSTNYPLPTSWRTGLPINHGQKVQLAQNIQLASYTKPTSIYDFEAQNPDVMGLSSPPLLAIGSNVGSFQAVQTQQYIYVAYGTGEHEFYDLSLDPAQLVNTYNSADPSTLTCLSSMLVALMSCSGSSCRTADQMPITGCPLPTPTPTSTPTPIPPTPTPTP